MDLSDKLIWIWLNGNSNRALLVSSNRLNPGSLDRVWRWVFKRDSSGAHVRADRCLQALRLRSKAYRRAGAPLASCAELALCDLAKALPLVTATTNDLSE